MQVQLLSHKYIMEANTDELTSFKCAKELRKHEHSRRSPTWSLHKIFKFQV